MTESSDASCELAWVWPRTIFSLTAAASRALPSVNLSPGRSWKVTDFPLPAYFHELARPACTVPLASRAVIEEMGGAGAGMSQPALEVTESRDVGSCHSQLRVPLAPAVVA